jgi:Protein of unknown function (DUF3604)
MVSRNTFQNRGSRPILFGIVAGIGLVFLLTSRGVSAENEKEKGLFWGDAHLHTNVSADAFSVGNESLSPEIAYRLARGEEVLAHNGKKVKLREPLDFLVTADHAEYLGVYERLKENDPLLKGWALGERWAKWLKEGNRFGVFSEYGPAIESRDPKDAVPEKAQLSIWKDVTETADRFNDPGKFTALIGYEWTSMLTGDNLHRVVLFRDDAEVVSQVRPYSAKDSLDPEDLWAALQDYEDETGGRVLAIPHNGNLSNGRMFAPQTINGEPLTASYAATRSRWEPVVEVTQMKGDSETHPFLSPTDEFADFETWDYTNVNMQKLKEPGMLQYEYARSALTAGLKYEHDLGVNPFKFGMIGSTDSHTSISTTQENNFWGKFPDSEPQATRPLHRIASIDKEGIAETWQQNWRLGAAGLAAVWAEENTRASLFDAFRRREVYATTGSRITLRFFGGWDYTQTDLSSPDFARVGYKKGVPMGGDLISGAGHGAPKFMVAAARDPHGANLDRLQIVKGVVNPKGEIDEQIYDVALSDGRIVDAETGKAPPVGSTVNVAESSYDNSIGESELTALWQDPDFDPRARAFYYVRVLEIPTPRWTAYDARNYQLELPPEVPMVVQDRAYSSPIWYTP